MVQGSICLRNISTIFFLKMPEMMIILWFQGKNDCILHARLYKWYHPIVDFCAVIIYNKINGGVPMTNTEIIYIAIISAIAIYAVFLTVMMVVMNKKTKKANFLLKEQMVRNYEEIVNAKKKIEHYIEQIDSKIEKEKEDNDKKIGEIFSNTMTATNMLVDEKTKNLNEKVEDINIKLNIMEASIKSIEREKVMMHSFLTSGEQHIESDYQDVPKDGFINNARKAVTNVAKTGSSLVKAIKRIFPK